MKNAIGDIIDGLKGETSTQYGRLNESTINEDEWKTMHGAHILIDGDGDIIAGGPKEMRKKATKKEDVKSNKEQSDEKSSNVSKSAIDSLTNKKYKVFDNNGNVDRNNLEKFISDKQDVMRRKKFAGFSKDEKEVFNALKGSNSKDIPPYVKDIIKYEFA